MRFNVFGKLGWNVSSIGFGGIPIQRLTAEEADCVIKAALEQGVNFIDTARGYTDSEAKIGRSIAAWPREELFLATKSLNRTAEGILQDVVISRGNLGVDVIDLYQLHNVKTDTELQQVLGAAGALEGLLEAKRRGWIKAIGITGHVHEILEQAIETGKFVSLQVAFNALETKAGEKLIPRAIQLGMGVIVMKPLAGGAFGPELSPLALRYLMDTPVSVIIPGMDSVEQAAANCRLAAEHQPLNADEQQSLRDFAQTIGQRFCRRCEYCLPCPQKINIPSVFLLEGYYSRYNLQKWAQERYSAMKIGADACVECGICEERCPYDLPIRLMLQEARSRLEDPGVAGGQK